MKNQSLVHIIYISLGSNKDEPRKQLLKAKELIAEQIGRIREVSDVYVTKAWGNKKQPDFLNQVMEVETHLHPIVLIKKLLGIELEMGRKRKEKWGARIIDLDLLFYDDCIIRMKNLIVPHPRLHERNFVLFPMLELKPDYLHPEFWQTIRELLGWCQDDLEVKRLKNQFKTKC